MKPEDLKVVKAIPGNDKCCDCGMKHPQWASVSFGNVFCLECSGVHRSLGVHITFVRSIAMDSWTPAQLKLMKAGGNDACNKYLHSKGVSKTASIKEKYESQAAALYKEVLKARAEGRPEPTSLPPPKNVSRQSSGASSATSSGNMRTAPASAAAKGASNDQNGMERLAGETDAQYIQRQTRLREEAKARMAAKFGNGGMNGKRTMGGVGSSPHPSTYSGAGGLDMSSFTDTLSTGLGSAASGLSSVFSLAKETVTSDGAKNVAKDVGSMGMGLWNSLSSTANQVSNNLNMEGLSLGGSSDGDGFSSLNEKMRMEKTARGSNAMYSGFGSDSAAPNTQKSFHSSTHSAGSSNGFNGSRSASMSSNTSASDLNSAAPLPGESDAEYMQRQMKIRENAKSMATKKPTTSVSRTPSKPAVAKMKVDTDDDFFATFGA